MSLYSVNGWSIQTGRNISHLPPPVEQLCSQRVVNDTDISGFFYSQKLGRTVQYESGLEFKVIKLLERCDQVIFYQEQPFSIPYYFKNKLKKYYPDLLIATVDGRCLLMEVKPTDRMALSLTRVKSNAGRKWAHTQGWGWLVISDRFSLRQLEEHAIPANIWKLIEGELKTSRTLTWREMMELRTRYEIRRLDLIAYIIQSGAEVDNFYRITSNNANHSAPATDEPEYVELPRIPELSPEEQAALDKSMEKERA
ncbi:Tn7 transposase TnsA N-terminal domain-containing protein, partial [Escherichia coli]|uniref:Tn7 transposase TnsA N-terminal domain-containing protein n=1 Tax=Escherichia coli TaxID=562 RepID=UPI0021122B54|nr:Tn7 transposase TnsA N-terminal domain-containing protein [Escherichia coli]